MRKIFTEYYSPQKNIFFQHLLDYQDEENAQPFKAESHSFYELLFVVSGKAEQMINENRYLASAGDLIVLDKQQLKKQQYLLQDGDYERYVLRFNPHLISLDSANINDIFHLLLFGNNGVFTILKQSDTKQANVAEYFQKIERLTLQPNDECTLIQMIATILDLTTAIHKQNQLGTLAPVQVQVNEHIRTIIQYVSDNIFSNLTLEKMATDLYLSPYYISHLFSKYMGMPLKKYINNIKIHKAQELIAAGESPTATALKLGFQYYSTFFNTYKKILGQPPSVDKHTNDVDRKS
ncbi:MAG: AraC family transcriptional regulator [Clostridiales bacterium]|nr:AraC family transcriptional regulator [Clostridiales bacterium]